MNSAGIVTYLDYARQICGTSHIIYADGGTENGNVLAIHFFQRVTRNDLRGEKRFMRRRSRANQIINNIEAWWGIQRKRCSFFFLHFDCAPQNRDFSRQMKISTLYIF